MTRNIGILPVPSNGHPAWSVMSRLGNLHDPSRWRPELLRLQPSGAGTDDVPLNLADL